MNKRSGIFFSLLLLLMLLASQKSNAQETDYKAYSLFVYNFMKYIEWPESEIQSKSEFVVGLIGDSPIFKELETLSASKKVKGKTIIVKKCSGLEDWSACHLLYVSSAKSSSIKILKEQVKNKPILIVGEREGLAGKGASLSFVTLEDDKLQFDINKREIEAHQLKISMSLLNLGILVD